MATFVARACLLGSSLSVTLAIRHKAEQQRSDDMVISGNNTVGGCACTDDCKIRYPLNCNAATFCAVDEGCAGAKKDWLYGYYDWCGFKDNAVKGSPAAQRHAMLVAKLKQDATPQPYFGSVDIALGVRGQGIVETMVMETDFYALPRKKYVRPVGVVAPVRFVSSGDHPYTGIFRGNDLGIIRLSLSLTPNDKNGFAPGIGLKFLRDNRPSANFLGFTSFTGQNCSEKNWFKYNMYKNVPPASGLSKLIPAKFKQASFCTQMVGLSDAADDFNGETPVFPFDIVFEGLQKADFSCGDDGAAGWENLGKFSKGTPLYRLKAARAPKENAVPIGDIILDGPLITSKFGDEELFFRHQRMEEDFAIHPEWLAAIDMKEQCGTDKVTTVAPDPKEGCWA